MMDSLAAGESSIMNGAAKLGRLRKLLNRDERLPEDIRQWLLHGLREWERSDRSLENSLGLIRTREKLELRDAHLREATLLMPHRWSVSERVAQIQRAARNLSQFKAAGHVDWENRPSWHEHVFLAINSAPLPGWRRLHDLCNVRASCKKNEPSYY